MARPLAFLLSLLLGLTTTTTILVAASPAPPAPHRHYEPRLEDVQCRCLSFPTSPRPTVCSALALHRLDWATAYAFAVDNDVAIRFSSRDTITKILAIPKPLPSGVLASIGAPRPPSQRPPASHDAAASVVQVVCGLGEEVEHLDRDLHLSKPELHYIGVVLAALTLFLIVWAMAEYWWTRCVFPDRCCIPLPSPAN